VRLDHLLSGAEPQALTYCCKAIVIDAFWITLKLSV
jgi:hypothetical protein